MTLFEEWIGLKYNTILFDSEYCNWTIGKSTFDKRLYQKNKFIIVIEDTQKNIFGGYINERINEKFNLNSYIYKYTYNDLKSFLFYITIK